MLIAKPKIPILHRIAELARKYSGQDPELASALAELDQSELDSEAAREEALKYNGLDCIVCGKRFLPLPSSGYSFCCSIGCKLSDPSSW